MEHSVEPKVPRNRLSLESINDDVFYEICQALLASPEVEVYMHNKFVYMSGHQSLKCLSSTNRNMRERLEPLVFRSIKIDQTSQHVVAASLTDVKSCPAACEHARSFHLKIHKANIGSLEAVDGLSALVATTLIKLPRLRVLSIEVPYNDAECYRDAIKVIELSLPSVQELHLGYKMEWMIKNCPEVSSIGTTKDWRLDYLSVAVQSGTRSGLPDPRDLFDFIDAASEAKNLHTFELKAFWKLDIVQRVFDKMPNLRRLFLGGVLATLDPNVPEQLARLTKLTTVGLPSRLHTGMPKRAALRDMYPDEYEYQRIMDEIRSTEQLYADEFLSACRRLEVFWIGNKRCFPDWNNTTVSSSNGEILPRMDFVIDDPPFAE